MEQSKICKQFQGLSLRLLIFFKILPLNRHQTSKPWDQIFRLLYMMFPSDWSLCFCETSISSLHILRDTIPAKLNSQVAVIYLFTAPQTLG